MYKERVFACVNRLVHEYAEREELTGADSASALMLVTQLQMPMYVQLLAESQANRSKTADGRSSLMVACENGDVQSAQILLQFEVMQQDN